MNTSLGCTKNESNLNNVEFASSSAPDGKAEEGGLLLVALHLELDERRRVTLDRLRHLALNAVQLHRSHHSDIREISSSELERQQRIETYFAGLIFR